MEESIKQYYEHAQFNLKEEDRAAIENIIDGYRELEEKNKRYERIYKEYGVDDLVKKINELEEFKKQVTEIESTNFIKYKNYIPISKIKEKIEELEESMNKAKPFDISYIEYCEDRIEVLQELMEDK